MTFRECHRLNRPIRQQLRCPWDRHQGRKHRRVCYLLAPNNRDASHKSVGHFAERLASITERSNGRYSGNRESLPYPLLNLAYIR